MYTLWKFFPNSTYRLSCARCVHTIAFSLPLACLHHTRRETNLDKLYDLRFGPHYKEFSSTRTLPYLTSLTRPLSYLSTHMGVYRTCFLVTFLLPGCTISATQSGRPFMAFCGEATDTRKWKATALRRRGAIAPNYNIYSKAHLKVNRGVLFL